MARTEYNHALQLFDAALARSPDSAAIRYFDGSLSYVELDRLSGALAQHLARAGVGAGDRVAMFLQNTPHVPITVLACWKLRAVGVPINPMNRERELSLILADCRPTALICLDDLYTGVVSKIDSALIPPAVLCVDAGEFQSRFDARVFPQPRTPPTDRMISFSKLALEGKDPRPPPEAEDVALLVYTSGTTGLPKGAIVTHRAFSFNAQAFPRVGQLNDANAILGVAPLFHITGIVCCFGTALVLAAPLILIYRFEPELLLEAIAEWRPKFVVAAITAFIAIFNHEASSPQCLESLQKLYSGGAPVPSSFVGRFEAKFGLYIHNCYGLTETAAPTHIVPYGTRAPTSPDGILSVGLPGPGVSASVVPESGTLAGAGIRGELVIRGPMVSPGYWQNPTETTASMREDGFHTGDIAFQDEDGWCYIIDRKKDVIISSGYKVWPREVEDVLYSHPAIREAAVVGIADSYRGETVKAFVSMRAGALVEEAELIEFCRTRMAVYKYPRSVQILDDLPKSATGKILRRSLRG
jgi:long-chain acyl-CoA synthetase